MSNNNNPKPILLIEAPAYVDDLLAISEGDMTLNDLIRNASKIKGWNFLVIQTQKPEFDYRLFYPPGNQETIYTKEDESFTASDEVFCNKNPEADAISRAFFTTPKSRIFQKVAKTEEEAFDVGEKFANVPHGWIQWKGTEVCMDVHCKCGKSFHIDATFAYNVKCPECETIYAVNGHVELIEMLDTSVNSVTPEE